MKINVAASPLAVRRELAAADVVIVHDGRVASQHRSLLSGKAVVTLADDSLNVDRTYLDQGLPGLVLGEHHATLPNFTGWSIVPRPVPLWEEPFRPGEKQEVITIYYGPLNKNDYPYEHRLYWRSRGYTSTTQILGRLAARFPVRLEVIHDQQPSECALLALKCRSHIVIDECVSGSYHQDSLEGLAVGCVVVNRMGFRPAIQEIFRQCAGGKSDEVFVHASLETLEEVLCTLIGRGLDSLTSAGASNRVWMERHWDFASQWKTFGYPLLQRRGLGSHPQWLVLARWDGANLPGAPPRVNVVVVTRNEGTYLRRTVHSLMTSLPANSEVTVVDDGSTDGNADALSESYDRVTVLRPLERLGAPRARNFGARHAQGEAIVFGDAHIEVPQDWMAPMLEVLERRDVGAVAAAINNLKRGGGKGVCGGRWRWGRNSTLAWEWLKPRLPDPHPVPLLGAGFLALRRDVFEAAGGFDSGMVMYGMADCELSLRLWTLGYECWVVPAVVVAHRFGSPAAEPAPDYKLKSEIRLHNKLRLGVVHFWGETHPTFAGRPGAKPWLSRSVCSPGRWRCVEATRGSARRSLTR